MTDLTFAQDACLPDLLRAQARLRPQQPAIVDAARTLTFAAVDAASDRIAAGLAARGVRPGDRVAVCAYNCVAVPLVYFGVVKAGAVVVPVNFLLHPEEMAYVLEDAGAAGLFYHPELAAQMAEVAGRLPGLPQWSILGPDGAPPFAEATGEPPQPRLDPGRDLAALLYTSGTTGKPKGVMLSHRNLVANTASVDLALGLTPGVDRIGVVLPMFHSFAATVGVWLPLCRGYSLAPLTRFEPEPLAAAVRAQGVTVLPLVPSLWGLLLRLPAVQDVDLAGLRFGISGGAAMPAAVMSAVEARFGIPIYEGDGPTECSPVTSINPVGGERRLGSIGKAVPGVAMRIVDGQGRALPSGEVGEIVVQGQNVMLGYWNRPQDTAEAFFGDWLRTGDLGQVDADGYFYIVDRLKDMLIVNGINVYPRVIEEVLYAFPPIREAAVVGAPDARHGEVPVAYVALKPGETATAAEVRAACQAHLGRHEVPRRVVIVEGLPRTATGKVNKRELRRQGEEERGVEPLALGM